MLGPVVEGGVALDQAVCFPVEGDGDGSAGAQEGLARDVGTRALQLLRNHFGIELLACEWCIGEHGFLMGVRQL